jgi:hypothetical protein
MVDKWEISAFLVKGATVVQARLRTVGRSESLSDGTPTAAHWYIAYVLEHYERGVIARWKYRIR